MIEYRDVYVSYPGDKQPILRGISAVLDGRHLILGPNGSGKTTLFKAAAGLAPVTKGEVLVDGEDVSKISGRPELLAVNLEEVYHLFRLSAYDHVRLYTDLMDGDLDFVLEVMEDLGLGLGQLRRRKPWELSAGQRKIFATALSLAARPRHLLLDEPFEQLDPARKARLLGRYLRDWRGVVAINTHETWLLKPLSDWDVLLFFEGRAHGPVKAEDLLGARLVVGRREEALVRFEAGGRRWSMVQGDEGEPISSLMTLDKIYEVAVL